MVGDVVSSAYPVFPGCAKFWGTGGWRSGEGGHRILSKCILRPKCINSCQSYLRHAELSAGSGVCQFKSLLLFTHPISAIRQNLNTPNPGHDTLFSLTTPPDVGLGLTIARIFHVRSWAYHQIISLALYGTLDWEERWICCIREFGRRRSGYERLH
jgi:hypothetical protein